MPKHEIDTKKHEEHLEFIRNITQYEQRSDEWFEQRKGRLTSSDAATALGINPYSKPVELLFKKCGVGKPFTGNESTLHGQKYEDEAIEKYCYLMGKKNNDFGMISYGDLDPTRIDTPHLMDEKYHFLGGSPDGIAEDTSGMEPLIMLEVKCPMRRGIKHGQVPSYYYPQVQLNMFILNLKIADFIEYIPGTNGKNTELNIVRVHRCEEWFEKNVPILREFWNEVLEWRQKDIRTHPEYEKYAYKPKPEEIKEAPDYLFMDDGEEKPKPGLEHTEECLFS